MDKKTNERNFGLDLLRILSMFGVVMQHTILHGIGFENMTMFSMHYEACMLLYTLAFVAVNCFALISGYVGVSSHYRYGRIVTYWIQALFYSIVITVSAYFFFSGTVSRIDLIKMLFPASNGVQWYFSAYFLLFCLMPGLNVIVKKMPRNGLKFSLIIIVSIISIFPTLLQNDSFVVEYGYSALWLAIMYLIGGYFAHYKLFSNISKFKCFAVYIGGVFTTFICRLVIEILTKKYFNEVKWGALLYNYNSPTIIIAAIALFLLFAEVRIKSKKAQKAITFFSSTTFGIYLIHTNLGIWNCTKGVLAFLSVDIHPFLMVLTIIAIVLCIYLVCTIIEFLRIKLFALLHIPVLINKIEQTSFVKKMNEIWVENDSENEV